MRLKDVVIGESYAYKSRYFLEAPKAKALALTPFPRSPRMRGVLVHLQYRYNIETEKVVRARDLGPTWAEYEEILEQRRVDDAVQIQHKEMYRDRGKELQRLMTDHGIFGSVMSHDDRLVLSFYNFGQIDRLIANWAKCWGHD